jgi:hypothetical protein
VSYYNGNEESKEESGREKEEVNPSPLFRNRNVFLTKRARPDSGAFVFLLMSKQTPVRCRIVSFPNAKLEHEAWQ